MIYLFYVLNTLLLTNLKKVYRLISIIFRKYPTFEEFFNQKPKLNVTSLAKQICPPLPLLSIYIFPYFVLVIILLSFLSLSLLFLPSGCQFSTETRNLLLYILFTCSNNLKLFSPVFCMIFVFTLNPLKTELFSSFKHKACHNNFTPGLTRRI